MLSQPGQLINLLALAEGVGCQNLKLLMSLRLSLIVLWPTLHINFLRETGLLPSGWEKKFGTLQPANTASPGEDIVPAPEILSLAPQTSLTTLSKL